MRCISPYADLGVLVFEPHVHRGTSKGQIIEYEEGGLHVQFEKSGLLDHEIDVALEKLAFSALPEGVNPLTRVSVFDSEMYVESLPIPADQKPQLLADIDARMRELEKIAPSHFVIVDMPAIPRPWPKYDEQNVETILSLREQTDTDPSLVRRYELENKGRKEIVSAMQELETESVEEITVSA
jgi:hypothetical protein